MLNVAKNGMLPFPILTYSCGRLFNAVILGAKRRKSMLFLLLMLCGIAILVQRFMEQGNAAAIGSTKTI